MRYTFMSVIIHGLSSVFQGQLTTLDIQGGLQGRIQGIGKRGFRQHAKHTR